MKVSPAPRARFIVWPGTVWMNIVMLLTRTLLGLLFLIFGLDGLLHFIPRTAPDALTARCLNAVCDSPWLVPVFLLQITGAVLLLFNRFVPLMLVILGPVVACISSYHWLMDSSGQWPALTTLVLWGVVLFGMRSAFDGAQAMGDTSKN